MNKETTFREAIKTIKKSEKHVDDVMKAARAKERSRKPRFDSDYLFVLIFMGMMMFFAVAVMVLT